MRSTPPTLLALFDEFEEMVNGQMFSFLDGIQEKIGALGIIATFDDGAVMPIHDLQVFPTTGDVSFRQARVAA